jgi:hypothetical protein
VPIDGSGHVEFPGEGGHGGHGAMGDGAQGEGFGATQPGEEVIRLAEIGHHSDGGPSLDPSRLDDAPVGMSLDAEAL